MIFEDLNSLFEFALDHDQTFVLGDLGRLPHMVVDYFSSNRPLLKILFVSPYYTVPVPNDRLIRQAKLEDAVREKCDVLVLAEPVAYSVVQEASFRNAARLIVFSSHTLVKLQLPNVVRAVYFHGGFGTSRAHRIRRLMVLQDGSEENSDARMVRNHVDHPSIVTVGPTKDCDYVVVPGKTTPLRGGPHFVIVDLSRVRTALSAFLYFWDAIDYMTANLESVDRWSACFCEGGKGTYDRFVQNCVDEMFCSRHLGNWWKELLPLLPFYKSGTVDRRYEVTVSSFVRHKYASPDALRDAFEMALSRDVLPLVGGVFSVIDLRGSRK